MHADRAQLLLGGALATDDVGTVNGCDDLARSLLRLVSFAAAVAGSPTTHVATSMAEGRASSFEWSINEKDAVEAAVGMSAAGVRSCVLLKHNGLNIALDSLMNAAVHSIGAALVVVCGDDPDAHGSTSVQDSRRIAEVAGVPVLEPTLLGDVDEVVTHAVRLSERARVPVVVRITGALHQDCVDRPRSLPDPTAPTAPPAPTPRLDTAVAHSLTKLGRYQRRVLVTEPLVQSIVDDADLLDERCAEGCETGVIAVGSAALAARDLTCCVLAVRASVPLPSAVVAWADAHDRTVVLEESDAVAERWLGARMRHPRRLRGRLTGHLPPWGSTRAADASRSVDSDQPASWTEIERKPSSLTPLSPFDGIFRAVASLRHRGAFVATDVGSSVRLCYPPYNGADVALSLGSAISVASGAARVGRPSIAVVGDFALLHSGLHALMAAAQRELPLLTVVLVNNIQAKTGGQPVPPVDLARLVEACGISRCETWHVDDHVDQGAERVRELFEGRLPAVAFVEKPADGTP